MFYRQKSFKTKKKNDITIFHTCEEPFVWEGKIHKKYNISREILLINLSNDCPWAFMYVTNYVQTTEQIIIIITCVRDKYRNGFLLSNNKHKCV